MSSSPPSPPFLNRLWPGILPLLAAFGIPTTVLTFFLTKHPLLALGVGLLYEAIVFILGFIGKVWKNLEEPWAKKVADWLDHRVQETISRYRKQYYQYLRYQHRDFDVRGLSTLGPYTLELDQVFVEPSIEPTLPNRVTSNPIRIPQFPTEGNYSIWNYLLSAPLSAQHLMIIGAPGSGKTTILKHITLALIINQKVHYRSHQVKHLHKLPILLFLREYAISIKERADFSLVDALHDHLKKWKQPLPPEGWFNRQLVKGRCLIMLDGLDEVADPEVLQVVVNWVERQMVAYHQNRFILTSRPSGYRSNLLSGVIVLAIRPFTAEQVERFTHQWYLANEIMSKQKDDPGVRMRARMEAKGLLTQFLATPVLSELTVNPLLLTMIATIHRYSGNLPDSRVTLYAEICEVFLGKRQKARGQELKLTPAQMQLVLEPLAYHLMIEGAQNITFAEAEAVIKKPLVRVSSFISPKEFLQLVENMSGLLVEQENGVYTFAHLTFQEYLTAVHIREKHLKDTLLAHLEDSWWQETIRLYCAMADATPIISACLSVDHPSVLSLTLALDCEKEAREVQPAVKAQLEAVLDQGIEDPDLERQRIVSETMLIKRLRQMAYLKEQTYIDTSLITCAEYQIFLDEQQAKGRYYQPDHWASYHFPPGQGRTPILGIRSSDATAFCAWLKESKGGLWHYRLPETEELEEIGEHGVPGKLTSDTVYWLGQSGGFAWAKGTTELLNNVLQEAINHDFNYHRIHASLFEQIRADLREKTLDHYRLTVVRGFESRYRRISFDIDLALNQAIIGIHYKGTRRNFVFNKEYNFNKLNLDNSYNIDFDHVLNRASGHTVDNTTIEFAFDRNLIRNLKIDFEIKFNPSNTFSRDFDNTFNPAFEHAFKRAIDDRLNQIRTDAGTYSPILDIDRVLKQEHNSISLSPGTFQKTKVSFWKWTRQPIHKDSQIKYGKYLLDSYMALVVLRARISGQLSPCEGILIIREY